MTIKSIGTDSKRQLYYDSQIAKGIDDYYAGRGEAPGEFLGTGAQALGLQGQITREQLIAMFAGKDPNTGEQLARRTARSTVTAFDLTFSAPKSISVLYAIGDERIARLLTDAHDDAVREALSYMEAEAARVRRGHNGTQAERAAGDPRGSLRAMSVAAEGFVAAGYRHRMSRSQDPQLHTHVVVMNMAKGPEGRWTALDGQHLYRNVKAVGFVYQAHLRQAVRQRLEWADWREVQNGMAELVPGQVSPAVLTRFSTRRTAIVARAAELVGAGTRVGPKGMERIALDTREPKRAVADPDWRMTVRAIAAEHELGREEIAALDRLQPSAWDQPIDERGLAEELFRPDGLTDQANTFAERDVIMQIAARCRQGLPVSEIRAIAASVLAHSQVVEIPDAGDRRFTTRELLGREAQIIGLVADGRGREVAVLDQAQVTPALAELPFPLSEDQKRVLISAVASGNRIDTVEALAGTGKTTTANAIRAAYETAGYRVIGAAPTGRAQTELYERAGIQESRTIDSWLLAMDKHPNGPGAVFAFATGSGPSARRQPAVMILDEAGMAHTRKSARLLQAAVDADIKVIAVGDSGQLSSVGAGGWLGAITRTLTSPLKLREVMRQRDAEERRLLAQVHYGQPAGYLDFKARTGDLHVFDGESGEIEAAVLDTAIGDLLAKRDELEDAGRRACDAVLISRDNPRRHLINSIVRERLRDRGELGHSVMIDAQEWGVGDQVIARRNDKRLQVHNGLRGVIVSADAQQGLTIQVENGTLRSLPTDYVREHLQYAYALTGHGMQGGTVQWAGVIGNSWDFTRNWSYTALSRSRERTRIYLAGGLSPSETDQEQTGPRIDHDIDHVDRMARRMRVRDDENLALEQLQAAERALERDFYGTDQDPALSLEDPPVPVVSSPQDAGVSPEHLDQAGFDRDQAPAPAAAAPPAPDLPLQPGSSGPARYLSPLREALGDTQLAVGRVNDWLARPEIAAARSWHDAQLQIAAFQADIERDPQPRGLRGRREWQERQQDREQRIAALRAHQTKIAGGLPDPTALLEQERDELDKRGRLMQRQLELRDEAVAYELAQRPECLQFALGPEPAEPHRLARWQRVADQIIAHRIQTGITDPADLGIFTDDRSLVAEIQSTRRQLGLQPLGREHGQDLGLDI